MDGRRHYDAPLSKTESWKPSMKTGINPKHRAKNNEGVMHIDYKPGEIKENFERRHIKDAYPSMMGPTNDNLQIGLRPFEQATSKS